MPVRCLREWHTDSSRIVSPTRRCTQPLPSILHLQCLPRVEGLPVDPADLHTGGTDGFLSHAHHVAHLYAERREVFEAIARKYLDGLAKWVSPVAGMFLWIDLSPSGIEDSHDLILKAAESHGVLAVPGSS